MNGILFRPFHGTPYHGHILSSKLWVPSSDNSCIRMYHIASGALEDNFAKVARFHVLVPIAYPTLHHPAIPSSPSSPWPDSSATRSVPTGRALQGRGGFPCGAGSLRPQGRVPPGQSLPGIPSGMCFFWPLFFLQGTEGECQFGAFIQLEEKFEVFLPFKVGLRGSSDWRVPSFSLR